VPGAVAVFARRGGGHVNIVSGVRPDGTVIYLNPSSSRQAWTIGPYRRRPIAFRVAA
jgi:surface antigen